VAPSKTDFGGLVDVLEDGLGGDAKAFIMSAAHSEHVGPAASGGYWRGAFSGGDLDLRGKEFSTPSRTFPPASARHQGLKRSGRGCNPLPAGG